MLNNEQIERDIDKILIFMNDCIEEEGTTICGLFFNFEKEDKRVMGANNWDENYFHTLLKKCVSRKFIEYRSMTDHFDELVLTESGQGRAISACLGKDRHYELDEAKMEIVNLTVNGAAQIGHNNILNTVNLLKEILNRVKKSNSHENDKNMAYKVLEDFKNNTLIQNAINEIFGDVNGR